MKIELKLAALVIFASATLALGVDVSVLKVDLWGPAEEGFQEGFTDADIVNGSLQTAVTNHFDADAMLSSGTISVEISTAGAAGANSFLSALSGRGELVDGTPEGFTYADIYSDIINATGPTGVVTLKLFGLSPNREYTVTVYSYDPGSTSSALDKVWSVTEGSNASADQSVNYGTALAANDTFAMDFTVTSTAEGIIELANTSGQPQNALNAFELSTDGAPPEGETSFVSISPVDSDTLRIECNLTTMPASLVSLIGKESLSGADWTAIPQSDDGINPYVITNMSYSTQDGSNVVVYVMGTDATGFYGLE